MRRDRALDLGAVLVPSAISAALTFYDLGSRSLWLDESASVTIAAQHGAALGAAMARDGGNMLAFYALLHVLVEGFGNGVTVVRAPSAIAAIATVAVVCLLALRLFDRRVALASGLLSAVSLPLVYWGQDARAYALMIACVAGSFLAFTALVEPQPGTRRTRRWWVAYVVVTTLAIYMSFVAVLVLPAQVVSLAGRRHRLKACGTAMGVTVLSCLPLAVLAYGRGSGQLFWVPKPDLSGLDQVAEALTSAAFQPNFVRTATSALLLWLSIALLAGGAAMGFGRARGRAHPGGPGTPSGIDSRAYLTARFPQVLLFGWLVIPVLLAGIESLVGQSIFTPRNLLVSLPPVGILLASVTLGGKARPAAGASGAPRATVRRRWLGPGSVAVAVLVVLVVLRALQLAPTYGVSPEGWKAATTYVLTRAESGDCIAFYPSDGEMAFDYYVEASPAYEARAPRPVLPATTWGDVKPYVERYVTLSAEKIAAVADGCTRLWLVASHQGLSYGPPVSVQHLERYLSFQSALEARLPLRSAAVFGYADPVDVELLSGRTSR